MVFWVTPLDSRALLRDERGEALAPPHALGRESHPTPAEVHYAGGAVRVSVPPSVAHLERIVSLEALRDSEARRATHGPAGLASIVSV